MIRNRQLKWADCQNARDLGGLSTRNGRKTRWGKLVRSGDPSKLTASGWASLYAYGIRTIVSLQTDGISENNLDAVPRLSDIATVLVAIEDISDTEFVQPRVDSDLWCTQLYYQDALRRWPERHAPAITAIAQA